jgi:ATP synthase protein I
MDKSHGHQPKNKKLWLNFHQKLKTKINRKVKAQKTKQNIWLGLGMFGIVGWSVTIPTLMGIALGIWIDTRIQSRYSWTLMLLFVGIILGCLNAWYWLQKESP